MPVPPQRPSSWNPIADTVGRVREIAGRAVGGSLTEEARRQTPGAGGQRSRQFFAEDNWISTSVSDPVQGSTHTAITSSLSGLVIGGPRRKGDFRVALAGWHSSTAGGLVFVWVGDTGISIGGAHIADDGSSALTFRWWIGGGAPWDPLPLIQVGFPATDLTFNPRVIVGLDYEAS